MHGERVVVITDIHGCLDDCRRLLDKMEFDKSRDRLINLGDTIDRGPQIYETFVFLRELKEEMGERCVLIRGNHEQMMLDATRMSLNRRNYKELWYLNSGEKTVIKIQFRKFHCTTDREREKSRPRRPRRGLTLRGSGFILAGTAQKLCALRHDSGRRGSIAPAFPRCLMALRGSASLILPGLTSVPGTFSSNNDTVHRLISNDAYN